MNSRSKEFPCKEVYPWTTKLSSAGLVYFHYGHEVLCKIMDRHPTESNELWERRIEYVYHNVYEDFMEAIDGNDNGDYACKKSKYC